MVAIIIPCYNEEKRFKEAAWKKFILSRDEYHFYFVNDGSDDDTLGVLKQSFFETPRVTIVNLSNNIGKGPAIRTVVRGIDKEVYNYFAFIDADLEIPLTQIDALYNKLKENTSNLMSLTYRDDIFRKDKRIRSLGSQMVRKLSSKIIKADVKIEDTQCGCKLFSTEVLSLFDKPFISKWLFDIEIILRYRDKYTLNDNFTYVRLRILSKVEGKTNYSLGEIKRVVNDFYIINKCYN